VGHGVLEGHGSGQQERKLHGEHAGAAGQIFPPGAIATVGGITTRRCMVPSCSIRVATTLISSFCARPVQQTTGRPGQGPAKTPVAPPCPGCSFLPFPACPGMRQPPGPSRGRGFGGIAASLPVPAIPGDLRSPVQACRSLPFSSPDKIIMPVITIAVGDRRSFVAGEQPGPWGGRRPCEPRQHVHASRRAGRIRRYDRPPRRQMTTRTASRTGRYGAGWPGRWARSWHAWRTGTPARLAAARM
jgi:hypothetical protein